MNANPGMSMLGAPHFQAFDQFEGRFFSLTNDQKIEAVFEVIFAVIGHIGPSGNGNSAWCISSSRTATPALPAW